MNLRALCISALLAGTAPALGAVTDLGKTLSGESCRLQGTDIFCGTAPAAAGSLHATAAITLPGDVARQQAAVTAAAKTTADSDFAALDCDSAQSLDTGRLFFGCSVRSNGLPRIVLVSADPRALLVAQGLPTMLPVLQTAIAQSSGRAFSPDQDAAMHAALEKKYPARILDARTADASDYLAAMEQGRQDGGAENFSAAETAYRHALDIATRLFGADSFAAAEVLTELALQVSNQGRFDEAAALFRRAEPIVQQSAGDAARARLASYRALDAANQRHYAPALQFARDALASRRKDIAAAQSSTLDINGAPPATPPLLAGELAHDLRLVAEMAMRVGDMPGAEAAAQEALYIVTQQPGLPLSWRPQIVSLMGEINARENRVLVAERDFADSVAMDKKIYGAGAPTAMAQMRLGDFYTSQQVYPAAISAYRDAFAILDKNTLVRPPIVADQIMPFLKAANDVKADGSARKTLDDEMFAAIQRIDSSVADQTIARVAARRAVSDPALAAAVQGAEDAARAADNLRVALAEENAKDSDTRDVEREKSLVAALTVATGRSDALQAKLTHDFPGYAALAVPVAVPLAGLQAQLGAHEAFVSFVLGVRGSYVVVVTRTNLTARSIDSTVSDIADDVADLRSAFSQRAGKLPDFNLKLSYSLYRTLLAPVAAELAGIDHLVVAPSGALASMPFALLVTSDPADVRHYGDAAWLIRSTAIAQVPSARAFVALRGAAHTTAQRPFLGLGDPVLSGSGGGKALDTLAAACQQGGPADQALFSALPPLPETAGEVQAVAHDLGAGPGDILLGPQATQENLLAKPLAQYAVLYFATHGLLPGELHCQAEPGLVLSPPRQQNASGDGILTASEIAGLRLNADLVVLSACNTAAAGGTGFGGGALDGLADAFFNAGARGVLASNWQVPSGATRQLMTEVFANLAHDPRHDVTEALRQAQLSLVKQAETAHPFDWAAFTLIGAGGGHT